MTQDAQAPPALTSEWLRWLSDRVAGCSISGASDVIVAHRVLELDGSEFCWSMRIQGGSASFEAGAVEADESGAAVVTFVSDRATAVAIAQDQASAQRAFLEGRLRIRGDVSPLISAAPALRALAETLS